MTPVNEPALPTTTLPEVSVPTFGPDGNADHRTNTLPVSVTEPSSPDAVPPSKRHPEQQEGELYMGGTGIDGFHKSQWETKRIGHVARYADGRAVESQDWWPWFIRASEVEQKIAAEEAARGPNSAFRLGVYRDMLRERS